MSGKFKKQLSLLDLTFIGLGAIWGVATSVPAHLVRLKGEDESEATAETYTVRPAAAS